MFRDSVCTGEGLMFMNCDLLFVLLKVMGLNDTKMVALSSVNVNSTHLHSTGFSLSSKFSGSAVQFASKAAPFDKAVHWHCSPVTPSLQ